MPLSEPAERELKHKRTIECWGYERADGLWDIEARLRDQKTYDAKNAWREVIPAGEPVHDMWVRLTIDEKMLIHAVETTSDLTPFSICGDVSPVFSALEGQRIDLGWSRKIRELVGGTKGCTHITELLGRMATAAYQTVFPLRGTFPSVGKEKRPVLLNSCHGWSEKNPAVKRHYPRWYTGP